LGQQRKELAGRKLGGHDNVIFLNHVFSWKAVEDCLDSRLILHMNSSSSSSVASFLCEVVPKGLQRTVRARRRCRQEPFSPASVCDFVWKHHHAGTRWCHDWECNHGND
jgi:hypothetical protein